MEDELAVGATYHSDVMSMLPLCDFIVITCTLNDSTAKMIRREHFQAMKKSAHFINVSRGMYYIYMYVIMNQKDECH